MVDDKLHLKMLEKLMNKVAEVHGELLDFQDGKEGIELVHGVDLDKYEWFRRVKIAQEKIYSAWEDLVKAVELYEKMIEGEDS